MNLQRDPIFDILPPSFEWIDIPAGHVTLDAGGYVAEGGQTLSVAAFRIAKYPLTNRQFQVFASAKDGYGEARWWDCAPQAQQWRARNLQPQAPAWDGLPDHPRARVTWFEAVAFSRWLSQQVGYEVRLPTDQEWQRAAQGDDGRVYPWGNDAPDQSRANWNLDLGMTMPVDTHPAGASPFGVLDMAGNVWEWCATDYDNGSDDASAGAEYRVLRGGSWASDTLNIRAANRSWDSPSHVGDAFGFRCVCSSSLRP